MRDETSLVQSICIRKDHYPLESFGDQYIMKSYGTEQEVVDINLEEGLVFYHFDYACLVENVIWQVN